MTAQAIPLARARRQHEEVAATAERGPRILPLMLFVGAVVGLFFSMIFLRVSLDENAFQLDAIERRIAVEASAQLDLRFELARLQDPLRIATEAQRIGLVYPDERVPIVVQRLAVDAQVLRNEAPVRALGDGTP